MSGTVVEERKLTPLRGKAKVPKMQEHFSALTVHPCIAASDVLSSRGIAYMDVGT